LRQKLPKIQILGTLYKAFRVWERSAGLFRTGIAAIKGGATKIIGVSRIFMAELEGR
jgi:hypothetical protein